METPTNLPRKGRGSKNSFVTRRTKIHFGHQRGLPVHRESSASLRFEFRLSSFERSGSLELFSQGEFEEVAELVRARMMPQLAQRLRFDLADALAGDGEPLAHFLERVLAAIFQAEAHLDDLLLARREAAQDMGRLFLEVDVDDGLESTRLNSSHRL